MKKTSLKHKVLGLAGQINSFRGPCLIYRLKISLEAVHKCFSGKVDNASTHATNREFESQQFMLKQLLSKTSGFLQPRLIWQIINPSLGELHNIFSFKKRYKYGHSQCNKVGYSVVSPFVSYIQVRLVVPFLHFSASHKDSISFKMCPLDEFELNAPALD